MTDVEGFLRILQPLMPDKVAKWARARDTGDPELRSLVERRIVSEAYRRFGDPKRKILLSLPPQKTARGPIELGTIVYDQDRWPLGLYPRELLQGTLIAGRSGSGKTVVALNLLSQIAGRRIPFILMDVKRSGRRVMDRLPRTVDLHTAGRPVRPFPFNPFLPPPGVEPEVYANRVVDVLAEAFTLGAGAQSVVLKALRECYARSSGVAQVAEVIDRVQAVASNERSRGWKATAIRALESVATACGEVGSASEQEALVRRMLHRGTILELDALGQGGRRFLAELVSLWLYSACLASPERESLRFVVFAEEAHYLLNRSTQRTRESVMEMLLRQGRELGIGFVVIAQNPSLLSAAALGNVYTTILLHMRDLPDLNRAAALGQLEDKGCLARLPVGHGIVRLADRWRSPMLVRFPMVSIDSRSRTDGELVLGRAGSGSGEVQEADPEGVRRGLGLDPRPSEEDMAFLEDVVEHPQDGVKARYRRLGLSVDRGTRLKARLLRVGWLDGAVVPVGRNSRKLVLRVGDRMRRALRLPTEPGSRRESLAHAFWKAWWAEHLQEQGYRVRIEASRLAGRIDILAARNGTTLGVEVETGWSDHVQNVQNCLRSGIDQVLVVTTDPRTTTRIETDLARAGLLIPDKVTLALGDGMREASRLLPPLNGRTSYTVSDRRRFHPRSR